METLQYSHRSPSQFEGHKHCPFSGLQTPLFSQTTLQSVEANWSIQGEKLDTLIDCGDCHANKKYIENTLNCHCLQHGKMSNSEKCDDSETHNQ